MTTNSTANDRNAEIPMPQDDTLRTVAEADSRGDGYPDMARVCRILARQVETLDDMFHHLRNLAHQEDGPTEAYERLSRLAFRAQAQTARTAAVLDRMVPPPPREPDEADLYEEALMREIRNDDAGLEPWTQPATIKIDTPPDSPLAELIRMASSSRGNVETLNRLIGKMRAGE